VQESGRQKARPDPGLAFASSVDSLASGDIRPISVTNLALLVLLILIQWLRESGSACRKRTVLSAKYLWNIVYSKRHVGHVLVEKRDSALFDRLHNQLSEVVVLLCLRFSR
jgi:uncharacterized membrane protein YGL010W